VPPSHDRRLKSDRLWPVWQWRALCPCGTVARTGGVADACCMPPGHVVLLMWYVACCIARSAVYVACCMPMAWFGAGTLYRTWYRMLRAVRCGLTFGFHGASAAAHDPALRCNAVLCCAPAGCTALQSGVILRCNRERRVATCADLIGPLGLASTASAAAHTAALQRVLVGTHSRSATVPRSAPRALSFEL
jgi:hypothetical protein